MTAKVEGSFGDETFFLGITVECSDILRTNEFFSLQVICLHI